MQEQQTDYDAGEVEARWRARWESEDPFRLDLERLLPEEKFYNLVEFPYPSGEGLHVGHVYTYCGADCYSRFLRMRGKKVFQPIGFDSFGIHTENYALRVGEHPMRLTARTIARFREILHEIGAAWNWDQEVATSDPAYYRWTQWIFVKLFEAGLAVRKEAPVVWCPSCLTVLANEQLEGDRCERCGSVVTQRVMMQWFFRMTEYADRLLDGLDDLDWPDISKTLQRAWIGRARATEVDFTIAGTDRTLTVFTTRPDTVFGVTFVVLAPDHPELPQLLASSPQRARVENFIERQQRAAPGEVLAERGVPVGHSAVNPATGQEVPIYVADYVVSGYGTGAVMGVPGHDSRDFEFARALSLPIRTVVASDRAPADGAYTGEGTLVESGAFSGLPSEEGRERITDWLAEQGRGRRATHYRLRDWLISRQRYWGPPIPIVYCDGCGTVPVPEDQLPVLLPDIADFRPTGTGEAPLASEPSFVNTTCPRCGGPARRETDVSDTFVDSAWYFLRYPSSDVDDRPWEPDRTRRVLPVDLYAGGREHVVRHHLYARFITMAMHDLGHLPFAEPFPHLRLHGLLIKDGAKMSKSRGNVVNPDDYISQVGVDNLRTYLLFCGDWEEGGDFSDRDLKGVTRFTQRLWRLFASPAPQGPGLDTAEIARAVARMEESLEKLKFNTAIARLMELTRWIGDHQEEFTEGQWRDALRTVARVLAPFAPHMAEEAWSRVGGGYSVHVQPWPSVDRAALKTSDFNLIVQVNGKVRDRLQAPVGIAEAGARELALSSAKVRDHLGGREPRQVVFVPDRLINLVG